MSKNIRSLSNRRELKDNLFTRLNKAGGDEGELRALAGDMQISPAITYGASSFYDFLQPGHEGKKKLVCRGTACLVSGNITKSRNDAAEAMCLGYCHNGGANAPVPVYNFAAEAILTGTAGNIEELYQPAIQKPDQIIGQLETSQLRGRGGAGFPFAIKLAACAREKADKKYIICNADEGDPGAFSDRYLLEEQPHKVLAGMFAAAIAAGSDSAILYIRREYPAAASAIGDAISHLPENVSSRVRFQIIDGAGSYACGEETALLNSIEGLRPEVRIRPPYPASHGLWGKPTIVSNVETFANIPWILQNSGESYAAIGTDASSGTKLLSLDSQFSSPGLYEVDFGTSFADLVYQMAGGFKHDVKALQVGGPLGSIIPTGQISQLTICFDSFQRAGFALGHAGIIAIPDSFPMIDFLRHIFSYMADESCGKCTPCRIGTAKGARMLQQATTSNPISLPLLEELLEVLEYGSLCALGGGLPLPVRNCLAHFSNELEAFFTNREEKA